MTMTHLTTPPHSIAVEESVLDSPLVETLRRTLPNARWTVVPDISSLAPPSLSSHDPPLTIVRFKGRFLRSCPATKFYHCCGYTILHFGERCTIGCRYCILQAYWNQPHLKLFGNTHEMFTEAASWFARYRETLFRVGTGEFTDSLLLDPWTGFSEQLVPFFASHPNAVLELKTKTNHIKRLQDLDHRGHTIVSWSLNAPTIVAQEERGAASLTQRIEAARRCLEWGYFLAFHFDPLFLFPGWEREYRETIERLFRSIPPEKIVYISLGAFRFMPALKETILRKNPSWKLASGEFVTSPDGKKRYFIDIRVTLYRKVLEHLYSFASDLFVYCCMENTSVWEQVFGFDPSSRGGLPAMLDDAVKRRMGIGVDCHSSAISLLPGKCQQPWGGVSLPAPIANLP